MTKIVELSHFDDLFFIHDGGQRLNNDKFGEPIMLQQRVGDGCRKNGKSHARDAQPYPSSNISTS